MTCLNWPVFRLRELQGILKQRWPWSFDRFSLFCPLFKGSTFWTQIKTQIYWIRHLHRNPGSALSEFNVNICFRSIWKTERGNKEGKYCISFHFSTSMCSLSSHRLPQRNICFRITHRKKWLSPLNRLVQNLSDQTRKAPTCQQMQHRKQRMANVSSTYKHGLHQWILIPWFPYTWWPVTYSHSLRVWAIFTEKSWGELHNADTRK